MLQVKHWWQDPQYDRHPPQKYPDLRGHRKRRRVPHNPEVCLGQDCTERGPMKIYMPVQKPFDVGPVRS
jgi:hypothetical protein